MPRQNIFPKGPNQGRPEIIRRPGEKRIDYRGLTQDQNARQINGGIYNLAQVSIAQNAIGGLVVPTAANGGVATVTCNNATSLLITSVINGIAGTGVPNLFMQLFLNKLPVTDPMYIPFGGGTAGFQYAPAGANTATTVLGFPAAGNIRFRVNFDSITFTNTQPAAIQTVYGFYGTGDVDFLPIWGQTAF
jgi:hypothetical protein